MNRVVHFEIQVEEPSRAIKFYENVFDWKFEQWGEQKYWMVMTADKDSKDPGINGGMLPRTSKLLPTANGVNAFVCTIQVDDFDITEEKIKLSGGVVALPKFAIPGMAWQGYFIDTEGNTFGIHQADKEAK